MTYPPPYLEFITLFNQHQFFEAHEVLELLWRDEKGPERSFYHGLIQIAAIFVHLQKGNPVGAKRLLETAQGYLKPYGSCYGGLDLNALREQTQAAIFKGEPPPVLVLQNKKFA